jgi:uroporphyrinogen-III synthase
MRALVTRPGEDGEALAKALEEIGIASDREPLMSVKILKGNDVNLDGVQAVLLTSSNGVRALAERSPRRDVPVFAVGDATAKTARGLSFKQVHSASGDVGALAGLADELLEPEHGPLVHVAGTDVAGDLAGELAKAGFQSRREVIYETAPARALSAAAIAKLKSGEIDTVLLFSPRSATIFCELVRKARLLRACREITIAGLSRAVADAVDEVKWKSVAIAAAPNQGALIERVAELSGIEAADGETDIMEPADGNEADAAATPRPEPTIPEAAVVPRPPTRQQRSRPVRTVFLTLLAVIALAGIATALRPLWAPYAADIAPWLVAKETNQSRIAELTNRLAQLEIDAKLPIPGLEDLQAERGRLKAQLESSLARIKQLEGSIEAVRHTVSELDITSASGSSRARAVGDLTRRLEALERSKSEMDAGTQERVDALQQRFAALQKADPDVAAKHKRLTRYVFVVGQLKDAVGAAKPFTAELDTLKSLFSDMAPVPPAIALLGPYAASGLETVASLSDRFTALAGQLVRTEQLPQGDGWVQRTLNRLTQSVKWRRVDQLEGAGIEAIAARTERALARRELAAAIGELEQLPEAAKAAAASWVRDAQLLVDAGAALDALRAHGFQELEGQKPGDKSSAR